MNSNFIGITTLHVSGNLSAHHQEFLAVHRHSYILCSLMTVATSLMTVCYPEAGWNCIKCTKADVRLRTSDDEQKGYPKHVES